jgi:pSer/pThr/pTyr-binding forkhead associated (FHA) protein
MIRALLSYQGDLIELPRGDTVVGRGVACRIRFNDPSVSREHLKFHVEGDTLTVEDLGSSNGTLVNGDPISSQRRLRHGDVIRIGRRVVQVSLERGSATDESAAAETSRHHTVTLTTEAQRAELTCPSCRAWIPAEADQCPGCGHLMAPGRPHARTRILKPGELHKERRLGRRYATSTPIFYTSEALAIDAQAHDLSLSGVFVATDLFDDIGSPCTITLLPDGGAPVHVSGIVRRVVEGDGEHQSGMGVEFRALSPDAERWLIGHLQKVAG